MAETTLTVQQLIGRYPTLPVSANAADITFAACDDVNGNDFVSQGNEILLFRNDDAGAQTVTISSVADGKNRTGDITTYSIGAGEYAAFGVFPPDGWRPSDGKVVFAASDANVKVAILRPA